MFIERLLNQGNAPELESMLRFTAQRHRLIAENVVNLDTPNYRQKDLSLAKFTAMLRERIEQRRSAPPGSVGFEDVRAEIEEPTAGILSHDGNNRSMEQLMSDQAKNALMHNLAVELLKKQFATMEMALRERVGEEPEADMLDVLDVGASGLAAQRARMDTIAGNILHANTTRNARGEKVPYQRRFVVFSPQRAGGGAGVEAEIKLDKSPFQRRHEPGHPDADAEGYVLYPNIDLSMEYVNALEASRAYEANVTMMDVTKAMFNSALRLIA